MCGCLNKTTTTVNSARKGKVNSSSSKSVVSSEESICGHMYLDIRALGVKIVLLLRKYKDPMLTEANKTVLGWMRNLDVTCPDNYELNVLTQFIDEYTEHNS